VEGGSWGKLTWVHKPSAHTEGQATLLGKVYLDQNEHGIVKAEVVIWPKLKYIPRKTAKIKLSKEKFTIKI
jgi:hypothetical protein